MTENKVSESSILINFLFYFKFLLCFVYNILICFPFYSVHGHIQIKLVLPKGCISTMFT